MKSKSHSHMVIVEAYEGFIEYLSDEPEERESMQGLGLPVEEIAECLDCRITILGWEQWYRFEQRETWVPTPATRPVLQPDFSNPPSAFTSPRLQRIQIPARDPDYGLLFNEKGLSPRSYGLINDSGLLFFASYCLNKELQAFYKRDPFHLAIMPMWGGVGYVAQMARATRVPDTVNVPFVAVVTDKSINRQFANQEGVWTRHAIIRRQMEDVSLALAEMSLVFGPRGKEIADAGRLPGASAPVCVPRRIGKSLLDKIARIPETPAGIHMPLQFFLYEPQQASSGVLTALDAVTLLAGQGTYLKRPMISAGTPMTFAPMKPREFSGYWSSRGAVRELIREHQWEWRKDYSRLEQVFPVRLYPSFFDHLPNIWAELARGSLVLLSPAAAEGLAPGEILPREVLIEGDPSPENVADCLKKIAGTDIKKLDQIRRELCLRVSEAHRENRRNSLVGEVKETLEQMLYFRPKPQDLSRIALLFLDRRMPLRTLVQKDEPPSLSALRPGAKKGTLSVVVTCYEMGVMIKESVESVWASERQPDEVLLIDDGSCGDETLGRIKELEQCALEKGLALKIIRQRNQGLASARNTGLKAANGEFISFLDGDDIIEPQFYQIALKILEGHPRLGGVAAWACIFGANIADGFWNAPQPEFPFLFIENSIIVPCVTRTELLRSLGGYDARQRYNYEDWELGIRMLASGWPIVTVPMHLLKYRVRSDSLYRSMTDVQNQVMRELLFNTHRETVSKFAVEIAMQLENQWKTIAYSNAISPLPDQHHNRDASFHKMLLKTTKRLLGRCQ